MHQRSSKRKERIRQVSIHILMVSSVFVVVTFITLFMLGFRFDSAKGDLIQYAFLQFDSTPSGATVSIDGKVIGSKTPNKATVPEGKHEITMWRDGYQTWHKSVSVKSGTLTWVNYALLVPKDLSVQGVSAYDSLYGSLASPKGNYMLIQRKVDVPVFDLVDLTNDTVKTTTLSVPKDMFVAAKNDEFKMVEWDDGARYVIISHKYGDKTEWIVLDTQDVKSTKNITKMFDIPINEIAFQGSNGNVVYVLDGKDIRKLDLGAGTISKPLASNVTSFEYYDKAKVITYVGTGNDENTRVAGVYREGDDVPAVIRTIEGKTELPLHISTSIYFNQNYIAISLGNKVDIQSGSYPNTTSDNANSMKPVKSYSLDSNVDNLSFSPTGEYVLTQTGGNYASYDLEYKNLSKSSIDGNGNTLPLGWLDDNHLWSDRDGKLSIREYDGNDNHPVNQVVQGQGVTLNNNGRFLYSIGTAKNGYQLQRVRMILP